MAQSITNTGDIMIYNMDDGTPSLEVRLENDTVWLTQQQIAQLFGVDRSNVNRHLNNIYSEGELDGDRTSAKIAQVRKEGIRTVKRQVPLYNLDAILSVGYRITTKTATKFRIWGGRVNTQAHLGATHLIYDSRNFIYSVSQVLYNIRTP